MQIYPAYFVGLGIVIYAIAYFVYARWYDKHVWEPDPKRTTPAHMYMDGIEFFPTGRAVLYGFQFKGIAGAAPIVGPFVALSFGWAPALLWILFGNFFIGWIHDYGALFTSVRRDGKTLGPLTYELISPRARNCLMGFLFFYLLTVAAAFMNVIATLFCLRGGAMIFIVFVVLAGIISGAMLYKMKIPLWITTIVGIIIMVIGVAIGSWVAPLPFWGLETLTEADKAYYLWMLVIISIICFLGAVLPIIWYAQPVNYMAFWPCIAGIILLVIGELASPIFGVTVKPDPFPEKWYLPSISVGPIWPILMVSIACGAISGWHSLVGTSGSARQLDVETDALPIGAGSMLTEGLLALSSLGAYMALDTATAKTLGKVGGLAGGACELLIPIFGEGAEPVLWTFYVAFIALYAITVLQLVIRFMRLALAEMTAPYPALGVIFGNKYVSAAICLLLGGAFAYSGAFINLWTLFGGSNQLMAGLALLLVSVHLANVKKPTKYNLGPAVFMIVTCLSALGYESFIMFAAAAKLTIAGYSFKPLAARSLAAPGMEAAARAFNVLFGAIGFILIVLGIIVVFDGYKALKRAWATPVEK